MDGDDRFLQVLATPFVQWRDLTLRAADGDEAKADELYHRLRLADKLAQELASQQALPNIADVVRDRLRHVYRDVPNNDAVVDAIVKKTKDYHAKGIGATADLQSVISDGRCRTLPDLFFDYETVGEPMVGGMGVVYKAFQKSLNNRVVAVKRLNPDVTRDKISRDRFQREADLAASVKHRNIVEIYTISGGDGPQFFVMEYCGGGTLSDRLRDRGNSLPARASAALVSALAEAVHAAHGAGVIHRDLKPGNILFLARSGDTADQLLADCPKITDFGLARRLDTPDGLSRTGEAFGTPSYMAPEQARGQKVGPAADVYSLGAILYECLTWRPPFRAETNSQTLIQVAQDEPAAPRTLNRSIPRDLETICLKCLEKQASLRYDCAKALAEDLQRFLDGEPIKARPAGALARAGKWVRRNRMLTSALVITAAALVGFTGWGVNRSYAERLQVQKDRAEKFRTLLQMRDGADLCEEGEAGRGVLLMAQSLAQCPDSARDLQRAIRTALASNAAKLHTLEAAYPAPLPTISMALSPDGKTVLVGGKQTFLVDVESGKQHVLQEPDGEISGSAFSPGDGELFATSTMQGTVRVSDTRTGHDIGEKIKCTGTVKAVTFSRDGKTLLVAAQGDVSLRSYDLVTRQLVGPTWSCQDNLYGAVYSPVADVVATAAHENNARLWDATTGQPMVPPMIHPGVVFTVGFSPDGKTLITGCRDGGARFWEVDTGKQVGPVLRHRAPVRSAVFSRDGTRVLTSSEDGAVRLWEAATGSSVGQILSHPSALHHALITPDQAHILTAGFEGTTRMWRIADESSVAKLLRCPGAVGAIAFSPDGRQVLTGCGDSEKQLGESQLWDSELGIPLGKPMPQSSGKKGQVMTVAFSPDGTLAFTGGNNNELRVWNTADASAARPPWLHENIVAAIAFSPNGKFVASSGKNGVVQVRDVASGEIVSTWDAEDREGFWVWSLAFTDDRTLLTGGGPVMQLWRWREKQRIGQGMEHDTEVRTTLLSPDKQMVLTCGHDMKARIWSAVDGRPLSEWMVHKGPVLGGAFRADGRVVATSSADGTLRVWSVPDGKTLMPPVLHDGRVQCVAFSPDGSTLATGCDDGVARLWNADDGASLGAVLRHRGPISRIAFSADGKRIVTGSEDGTARIWMPPAAIQGTPEAVTLWAEVLTGLELDEEGMSQVLPRDEWQRRRRRLEDAGGRLSLKP